MKRRGFKSKFAQVSIFIILAVVVLVVIWSFFYLNGFFGVSNFGKFRLNNVENAVVDCVEQTSLEGLDVIGVQGGYYNRPENAYDLNEIFVPYYYYEGEYFMPSKEDIESELEDYVNNNLNVCLDRIDIQGYELSYDTPESSVVIGDKINFKVDMQVNVVKDGEQSVLELRKFPVDVKSKLKDILEVIDYYIYFHKQNPAMYCINCLGELAEEKELYVDIVAVEDNSEFFIVSDDLSSEEVYSFEFLNKYTGEEVEVVNLVGDEVDMPEPPVGVES